VTRADVAELHGSLSHTPISKLHPRRPVEDDDFGRDVGDAGQAYNPCKDIERYPERKRARFLSPKELQCLGRGLTTAEVSETETTYAVAAFRILLLTGCRLSEIQTLEWRHVDLLAKKLRLPDSKTGAKTVHLGEAAVALLEGLPRVHASDRPSASVARYS
jgi:integrase